MGRSCGCLYFHWRSRYRLIIVDPKLVPLCSVDLNMCTFYFVWSLGSDKTRCSLLLCWNQSHAHLLAPHKWIRTCTFHTHFCTAYLLLTLDSTVSRLYLNLHTAWQYCHPRRSRHHPSQGRPRTRTPHQQSGLLSRRSFRRTKSTGAQSMQLLNPSNPTVPHSFKL